MKKAIKFFGWTSIISLALLIVFSAQDFWGKFISINLHDSGLAIMFILGLILAVSVILLLGLTIIYALTKKKEVSNK